MRWRMGWWIRWEYPRRIRATSGQSCGRDQSRRARGTDHRGRATPSPRRPRTPGTRTRGSTPGGAAPRWCTGSRRSANHHAPTAPNLRPGSIVRTMEPGHSRLVVLRRVRLGRLPTYASRYPPMGGRDGDYAPGPADRPAARNRILARDGRGSGASGVMTGDCPQGWLGCGSASPCWAPCAHRRMPELAHSRFRSGAEGRPSVPTDGDQERREYSHG